MGKMKIDQAAEYLRKNFFPRWDRAHKWKIRMCGLEDIHYANGLCDKETKTISIAYFGDYGLEAFLIHEICHAVTDGYHGIRRQSRMEKAAKKRMNLAEMSWQQKS